MILKKIIGAGFCATLLLILCSTALGAASSQWFPSSGTNCDYSVTWYVTYTNGTKLTDSTFNVYNDTSNNVYYVPTQLDPNNYTKVLNPSYTQVVSQTSLTVRHAYLESTATVLSRSSSLITGSLTVTHVSALIVTNYVDGLTFYNQNVTDDSVQKQGFFSNPSDFLDFFNFAFQPPDEFIVPWRGMAGFFYMNAQVIAKTDSQMVAFWSYETSSAWINGTYVAESSGRVSSFSYVYHSKILVDQEANGLSFVRLPDGIPGYGCEWILAAIGIGILFVISQKKFRSTRLS